MTAENESREGGEGRSQQPGFPRRVSGAGVGQVCGEAHFSIQQAFPKPRSCSSPV